MQMKITVRIAWIKIKSLLLYWPEYTPYHRWISKAAIKDPRKHTSICAFEKENVLTGREHILSKFLRTIKLSIDQYLELNPGKRHNYHLKCRSDGNTDMKYSKQGVAICILWEQPAILSFSIICTRVSGTPPILICS